MKLRTKLLLAYLVVTASVMAVLYLGFKANRTADDAFEQATAHAMPMVRALHHLRSAGMRVVSSTSEYLFLASATEVRGTGSERARELAHESRLVEDGEREFDRALQRYGQLSRQGDITNGIDLRDISQAGETLQREASALRTASRSRQSVEELLERREAFEAAEMRLLRLIDGAIAREELRISGMIESSAAELDEVRTHYASLVVFLALAAFAMGIGITYFVSRPMRNLIARAARIERQEARAVPEDGAQPPRNEERRARPRSSDEVRELHLAFDAMEQRLEESRQRLRMHQEDLEHQIALRTHDLEQALEQAEMLTREARAASDAKAAFLANMSHEIRTPLNGVLGTAELLSHTELNAHQHDLVHTITRSGNSLLRIINDILDFSKIDAGRLDLDHAPFTPGATLEEVIALLAPGARSNHLDLIADIAPSTYVPVLGDAGRLRQIVLNIVSNAIKFTEQGEVRLRASAQPAADHAVALRIEIEDTGIGMSEDVQKRLFQPFSQADASTTRRFGGTGLGLAISRQLAELMHGTLRLSSTPGKGTIFTLNVMLPVDTTTPPAPEHPAQGLDALICIAHPLARHAALQQLHALGFQAEAAATLEEAAGIANRKSFAVIMAEGLDTDAGARLAALAAPAGVELIPIGPFSPAAPGKLAARVRFRFTKPVLRGQLLSFLRHRDRGTVSRNQPGNPQVRALHPDLTEGMRVLVAEDNAVNRMVALQMLKRLGIDARAVSNGAEAVETQIDNPSHLILMDCQMPEMDGYEATRAIRDHEHSHGLRHVPIIALTANALKGDRERTLEAGMDDYLSKPVSMDGLANALEKWLPLPGTRKQQEIVS